MGNRVYIYVLMAILREMLSPLLEEGGKGGWGDGMSSCMRDGD